MKTFFIIKLLRFVHLKLRTTEQSFPFVLDFSRRIYEALAVITFPELHLAPIDSCRLYFSHSHSFVKLCFTLYLAITTIRTFILKDYVIHFLYPKMN